MQSERRYNKNRRTVSRLKKLLNLRSLHGQRYQMRRKDDHIVLRGGRVAGHYVDRYESTIVYLVVSTLFLCSLDAFLTLRLLELGAFEANLVMDVLIQKDVALFVITKFALTSLGLIFLVTHYKFHVLGSFRVSHLLYGVFALYAGLICYEIVLLLHF